jgi:uncharacterized circularly permuted ATP-grasp superfamily protein
MDSERSTDSYQDGYDEAWAAPEVPRPGYEHVVDALPHSERQALRARIRLRLWQEGVTFNTGDDAMPFVVDPVPRVLTAEEWKQLAPGLEQRVAALEAFVHDVYGDRRIVDAGVVPRATIETAAGYEPDLVGRLPALPAIGVAGLDVVRDPEGRFLVLEDNLRTPSGFAYAAAAREALEREPLPEPNVRAFHEEAFAALGRALRAATPDGGDPSSAVVLSDGPHSSAYYEHAQVAERLGIPLVTPSDLEVRDGRLVRRGGAVGVDVLYRRCDEDRMRDEHGDPTAIAELLRGPWLAGRLGMVNAFGTGVADDKAIHAYVEEMIRFYLDEEPLVRSVRTLDLADEEHRREAFADIDKLVVKPRDGQGGSGVVVCAHATREDVQRVMEDVERDPSAYVAQHTIALSQHPTLLPDGSMAPRHVDLRPFAFATGDGYVVPAGGLTRVALQEGSLVVNSSQNGGGKDTWVLE